MSCLDSNCFLSVNDIMEEIKCPICQDIMINPVFITCPNNHIFGELCVNKWFETKNHCPLCAQPCTNKSLNKVQLVKNMIGKLEQKCKHTKCEWKGIHNNYFKHLQTECRYETVICKYCNKFRTESCNITNHYKECLYFPIMCEYCQEHYPTFKIEIHKSNVCVERPVECPHCKTNIKFKLLNQHKLDSCPEFSVFCKYNCKEQILRKNEGQHYKEFALEHLKYVEEIKEIKEIKDSIIRFKSENISIPVLSGVFMINNICFEIETNPFVRISLLDKIKKMYVILTLDNWHLEYTIPKGIKINTKILDTSTIMCESKTYCSISGLDSKAIKPEDKIVIKAQKIEMIVIMDNKL
jgi:hypothetical protein